MIRLNDEEIANEMGLPYPPEKDLEDLNYAVVDLFDLRPLARAQLKKVVEYIVENSTIHSMDMNPPILTYMIDGDKVQALLEEVK